MVNSGVITANVIITHVRLARKFMEGLLIGKRRVRVVHFKQLLIKKWFIVMFGGLIEQVLYPTKNGLSLSQMIILNFVGYTC